MALLIIRELFPTNKFSTFWYLVCLWYQRWRLRDAWIWRNIKCIAPYITSL